MSSDSRIEWTGATWSPVIGCSKVDAACGHCYIERTPRLRTQGMRFRQVGEESTTGLRFFPHQLERDYVRKLRPYDQPIFVCSLSDLFHEAVPDDFLAEVWGIMDAVPERTFQVLTKRPERARDWLRHWYGPFADPAPNVWVGTSIGTARYSYRADVLREIPAAVRFLSCEPLLGSLYSMPHGWSAADVRQPLDLTGLDWVIVGGESGGRFARPMRPEWAREIRDAVLDAGEYEQETVCCGNYLRTGECCANPLPGDWIQNAPRPAFFFKQWGSHDEHGRYAGAGPSSGGRLLDGREWNEMPEPSRVAA